MSRLMLTDASFRYGHKVVLESISFETVPGGFTGIIGPNGSGKSTLLKGLAGILRPCAGRVTLDNVEISSCTRMSVAKKITLVPQYAVLPDLFSVMDIVLMGRTPHLGLLRYESSKDIDIALAAMEATQITGLAHKRINELSGGERQRVLIARGLAQEATIMLLDEPTANLDINYQAEVLNFLQRLCREKNMTVVAALHDLNLASQYCDCLVMLKGGRIRKQGSPSDVIDAAAIREIFGIATRVYRHPVNGLPTVLVTPPDTINGNGR